MKKYIFSDKSISDGSIVLETEVIVANTFTDSISDWNIAITNNFEKKSFNKLWKNIFFLKMY